MIIQVGALFFSLDWTRFPLKLTLSAPAGQYHWTNKTVRMESISPLISPSGAATFGTASTSQNSPSHLAKNQPGEQAH
jgi:hypothetical protein